MIKEKERAGMVKIQNNMTILMAEDDPDDRLLLKDAIDSVAEIKSLEFVEDGEQLMDYLLRRNKYITLRGTAYPYLLIIDLNMPRKDGREAIREIKANPKLRKIPIVVLTTSRDQDDIGVTYDLGVNSYVSKPASFDEFTNIMKSIIIYWSEIVELPKQKSGEDNIG